ncbi:MAG: SAVED domain-containing protein, partial [Cyanobacteria bacterium J06598_4]
DRLWEIARSLTVQQRAEILGAPLGYEHLFFTSSMTSTELSEVMKKSWFILIQDKLMTIDLSSVEKALNPDISFGYPTIIRPELGQLPWTEAAEYQKQIVDEVIAKSKDISLARFAVFSLTPIPLAVHLGFVLTDGVKVRYFQYDRDRGSWQWPQVKSKEIDCNIQVSGLPEQLNEEETEAVIRVSLSNTVLKKQTDTIVPNCSVEVDIFVDDPDVAEWLVSSQQLTQLAKVFRKVLKAIRNNVPNCARIHLFGAVPTGACIVMGQAINPRMNAPVELYQFDSNGSPPYKWALTLKN